MTSVLSTPYANSPASGRHTMFCAPDGVKPSSEEHMETGCGPRGVAAAAAEMEGGVATGRLPLALEGLAAAEEGSGLLPAVVPLPELGTVAVPGRGLALAGIPLA
jgi:hypothetical protein